MKYAFKRNIIHNAEEIYKKLQYIYSNYDHIDVSIPFNQCLDSFVSVGGLINSSTEELDKKLYVITENISNLLVNMIETYNCNNKSAFMEMLIDLLKSIRNWVELLNSTLRYKVIVFGINEITFHIDNIIDLDKAELLYYIDDTGSNTGNCINGIDVKSLDEITNDNFDFIISVSNNEEIVEQIKDSELFREYFVDYLFYKRLILSSPEFIIKYTDFLQSDNKINGILTGLSYTQTGVDVKKLNGDFFNFANPAQDIYYDFEMLKYAFSFEKVKQNLKYVIIGLSYYSFHYDLSKGRGQSRVNYYYPIVKTMHNSALSNQYLSIHQELEMLEKKILYKDHLLKVFDIEKKKYQRVLESSYKNVYNCNERSELELLNDIKMAKRDFNKNYPLTVEENKQILRDYLDFLSYCSIKPIIIVCPVTRLYRTFTPKRFELEFRDIILELSSEYKFQYLDYYHSTEFEDEDFCDPSHLNKYGSIKLASLLNSDIEW